MGVLGLWEIIAPAGVSRSLTQLAVVDGFESNASRKRAYRVGIDVSIWYKHAQFSEQGENPELRLLFFRLRRLAELPILPLFVFDGRERPKVKRGSRMGKSGSHNLTQKFKELLDVFGMEWRMALGEAEAELAFLNRSGVIDAVITDDADALVFGATTIMLNVGSNLPGNKSKPAHRSDGKKGIDHTLVFTAEAIRTNPSIQLSRGGMILFALLSGGDYDKGVDKFGKMISHALARCGFGDELLHAFERREAESLHLFFPDWRRRMNQELATNSRGFLDRAYPRLNIPPQFPSLEILERYAAPRCSASLGQSGGGQIRGNKEMNLANIAGLCEKYFEWGTRNKILRRFASLMWKAAVIRVLRRACMEQDEKDADLRVSLGTMDRHIRGAPRPDLNEAIGTPASLVKKYLNISAADMRAAAFANQGQPSTSQVTADPHPILTKIHSERRHVSTDNVLEYRVEVNPKQFVELTLAGIKGTRAEEPSSATRNDVDVDSDTGERVSKRPSKSTTSRDPYASLRMWIPASMLWRVHPGMAEDFQLGVEEKARRRSAGGRRQRAREEDEGTDGESGHDDNAGPGEEPVSGRKAKKGRPQAKGKGKAGGSRRKAEQSRSHTDDEQRPSLSQSSQPHIPTDWSDMSHEDYLPSPPATQPSSSTRERRADRDDFTSSHPLTQTLPSISPTETTLVLSLPEELYPRHCRLNGPTSSSDFLFSFPHPDDPSLVKMPGFDDPPSFECQFASLNDSGPEDDDDDDDDDLEDPFSALRASKATARGNGKGKAKVTPIGSKQLPSSRIKRPLMPTEVDDCATVDLTSPSPSKRHKSCSSRLSRPASSWSPPEVIDLGDDEGEGEEFVPIDSPLFLPSPASSPPPSSSPNHDLVPQYTSSIRTRTSVISGRERRSQAAAASSSRRTSTIFDGVSKVIDLTGSKRARKSMP